MDLFTGFVDAVKAAVRGGVLIGNVITVVGKLLTRSEAWGLPDDFIPFDHKAGTIGVEHDPFASQQGDRVFGFVADRDEVNEGVWLVRRKAGAAMVITQFIQTSGEAGNFAGARHGTNRTGIREAASTAFSPTGV